MPEAKIFIQGPGCMFGDDCLIAAACLARDGEPKERCQTNRQFTLTQEERDTIIACLKESSVMATFDGEGRLTPVNYQDLTDQQLIRLHQGQVLEALGKE